MKPVLRVFIAKHCAGCIEARFVAARIERRFSGITVEIIDIDDPQAIVPEAVFATPTFMLDNRIISLGTPHIDEVAGWIEQVKRSPN